MDYNNKYLKYKNKYLKLREELISQGVDVDKLMKESLNQLGNKKVEQNGGNDENIFITQQELSELNFIQPNLPFLFAVSDIL